MKRRDFLAAVGKAAVFGPGLLTAAANQEGQQCRKHYRVIDTHLHMFNTKLNLPTHFGGEARENATVEKTIAAMKKGGVEKAFLISYTSVDIARDMPPNVDPAASLPVYSREYMIDAWKANREMFYWFPDHVDPSRAGYLEDLQRDLEQGAEGVKILSAFHGFLPDNPGFVPVYEMCRKFNKPVIIDGSFWYFGNMPPNKESQERQKEAATIAGYTKMLAEVFRGFPTVAFSLAHTGTASQMSDYDEIYKLISDNPNVSCDIAASPGYGPDWLENLVRAVGAAKVMYGTDWPYWATGVDSYLTGGRRWTMVTDDCPNLSELEKRLILAENADRFIKNQLPAPDAKTGKSGQAKLSSLAERALVLHRNNPVIVIHDHNPIAADVSKMLAGGVTGKCYQLGVDVEISGDYKASMPRRDGWAQMTMNALEDAERTIKADPERLMLATTAEDFLRAKRDGKVAIMFGVEGGKLLEGNLEWLDKFYQRGLRELQLTWASPNQIVESAQPDGDGLTDFGRQVVCRCNQLGIIVDLTHIPRRAFRETIALTTKPPILSHEAIGAGIGAPEAKAIASRGGVIAIHFYAGYMGQPLCPDRVVDQVDKIAGEAGIETVGLGCDFFPTTGGWADFQHSQGTKDIVWAVQDIGHISQVTEAMLARNYSENDISKVLGGNFLRVCKEVFGK